MIAGVADTHAALWYLYDDGRLSVAAGEFIDHSAAAGNQIVVSSISLAEIVYLVEKNRLPVDAYTDLKAALDDPDHVFKEAPFTVEIVDAMRQVPRAHVADMPDRIVAATAVFLGCRQSAGTGAFARRLCRQSGDETGLGEPRKATRFNLVACLSNQFSHTPASLPGQVLLSKASGSRTDPSIGFVPSNHTHLACWRVLYPN